MVMSSFFKELFNFCYVERFTILFMYIFKELYKPFRKNVLQSAL